MQNAHGIIMSDDKANTMWVICDDCLQMEKQSGAQFTEEQEVYIVYNNMAEDNCCEYCGKGVTCLNK